jgi:hypothetical protein
MILSPLHVDGTSFVNDQGTKLTYVGFSEFRLLDRFMKGEDVEPIFADRNAVLAEVREIAAKTGDGAWIVPVLRVFSMAASFMQLKPGDYPYTAITALTEFAHDHGFYVDWECLADTYLYGMSLSAQQQHWQAMGNALRPLPYAMLSLVNEYQHGNQRVDPGAFQKIDGVLCSRGSNLSGGDPYLPAWDYSKYHAKRGGRDGELGANDARWATMGYPGDPGYKGTHQATIVEETCGAAESDIGDKRSSNPQLFHGYGWDSAKRGAGGVFHSTNGVNSELFQPITRACALAYVMGAAKCDPQQRMSA